MIPLRAPDIIAILIKYPLTAVQIYRASKNFRFPYSN